MEDSKDSAEFKSSVEASNAFLFAEKEYVENGLRKGFETFYNRLEVHDKLNKSIIPQKDIHNVFGSYKTLYNANSNLLTSLMNLRLKGEIELRDGLGKVMVDFIPYLKLYIDYIVKKQDAIERLEELKSSSKKFREFLKINEHCVKRKLSKFLDEPIQRLPQYLQQMADIYVIWEKESLTDGSKELMKAIVDIKKATDEIALKSKDLKARKLVGQLQKKIFSNKIALIASHRYVITHGVLKLVIKKQAINHNFILCNDILCIGTQESRWSSGTLLAVFPLIGLRVLRSPLIPKELENEGNYRFAIIPQNKNFTPSESNAMGTAIMLCDDENILDKWIDIIEDAVDEEEHNLRPCNPVDLEKRLRKEKCSNEGLQDTITINDQNKIKEIQEWRENKLKNKDKIKSKENDISSKPLPPAPHKILPRTASIGLNKPPPPRSGGSIHSGPPPKGAPPPRRQSTGPPSRNKMNKAPPKVLKGLPPPKQKRGKLPPTPENKKPDNKNNKRASLLAGISGFKKNETLKKVVAGENDSRTMSITSQPETMGDLLQNTLANYRQFVMDDDDDADESSENWDD